MQPDLDTVGEVKTNGTPAVAPGEPAHVNGNGAETVSAADLHNFLHALQAVRVGDFSVRMAGDHVGLAGKIADTFNEIVAANQRMARQLERVGQVVGRKARRASAYASG